MADKETTSGKPVTGSALKPLFREVSKTETPPIPGVMPKPDDVTDLEYKCLTTFIDALSDPTKAAEYLIPYARAIDSCVWFTFNNLRLHDDPQVNDTLKTMCAPHFRDFFFGGVTLGYLLAKEG